MGWFREPILEMGRRFSLAHSKRNGPTTLLIYYVSSRMTMRRPLIIPELPGGPGYPLLEIGVLRRRHRAPQPVVVYRGIVARPVFTADISRRIYPASHEMAHVNHKCLNLAPCGVKLAGRKPIRLHFSSVVRRLLSWPRVCGGGCDLRVSHFSFPPLLPALPLSAARRFRRKFPGAARGAVCCL